MDALTKKLLKTATFQITTVSSRYGTKTPTIKMAWPRGTSPRLVAAALHHVAAAVELATSPSDRWNVSIDDMGLSWCRVIV